MMVRWIAAVALLAATPLVAVAFEPASSRFDAPAGVRLVHVPEPEPVALPESASLAPPLTLDALIEMAFQHNPTLAMAAARIGAARGAQVQAGLYPNPMVGYSGMEMGNEGTPGMQGAIIGQRIITGGKLRLDQAIAGRQVAESNCLFHAQEQRVLSDVRVRFHVALVAQERLNVTQQLVRIGDDLGRATEQLVEGRQAAENDLLQARIEAEQARILLDNSHNEYIEAWRRLAAVVGVRALAPASLAGNTEEVTPEYDWDECHRLVLAGNPELAAARQRVERLRLTVVRARRENVPNLDLMVGIRHAYMTDSDTVGVEVGMPIPILNRNQGNISRAQCETVMAIKEVERIELDLQDRLAVAYRRYRNAAQQVQRYQASILPPARRSLDLVTRGYESGQVEYLALLIAQRTYYQVHLAYLTALQEWRTSAAVIEGQLLTGSLGSAAIPMSESAD